jgi:hypothetical protein
MLSSKGMVRALSPLAAMAFAATIVALPTTADATSVTFGYVGDAGGTKANVLGLTVKSDLTAESSATGVAPRADSNSTAGVTLSKLASVGVINTDVTGTTMGDGVKVVSHAKTANVSLLGGLIQVDAVDTTATASGNSTSAPSGNASSSLLGLTIAGKKYPVNVPANTTVGIPGVATVTLNANATKATDTGAVTIGAGVVVSLLKAFDGAGAGSQIMVSPVYSQVVATPVAGNPMLGYSYGSYVTANVGSSISVEAERTAAVLTPSYGTNGKIITNSTAHASLPGVLDLGAIESTGSGEHTTALADVQQTAKVAGVNLFNGLITATAIKSSAHANYPDTGSPTTTGSVDFVDLTIAGKAIPLNVKPNTKIDVLGLGTVTVNEQALVNVPGVGLGMQVRGLHIVLDTSRAGLPVGASIEIATTGAFVYDTPSP